MFGKICIETSLASSRLVLFTKRSGLVKFNRYKHCTKRLLNKRRLVTMIQSFVESPWGKDITEDNMELVNKSYILG
ncbi:hypothetical protein CCS79_07595 [Clostridium diolis]|uniref:hypothetical protein n=1 Tax=Clostridium diolis TaxID=223919 RepID=UPI000B402D6F|nr:hypothetical protein [Clostridium diolis]MBE6088971.1 hypothetical protein [Clostridium beijerinckii]OVE69818.1 hypothetical protein CCS79_07595 [Clostridium diolis]